MNMKPPLIDQIVSKKYSEQVEINDRWYIAKPLPYYYSPLYLPSWIKRFYYCWLVLTDKAMVFQYAEDGIKETPNGIPQKTRYTNT